MTSSIYYIGRRGSWIEVTRDIFTRYMLRFCNKGGNPMMRIERYRDEPAPHVVINQSCEPVKSFRLFGHPTQSQAEAVAREVMGK